MSNPGSGSESARRTVHVPVLLREVLDLLAVAPGQTVVDGTLGAGGHSAYLLKSLQATGRLIGLDRDASMIARAAQVVSGENVHIEQTSYRELDAVLDRLEIKQVDRVLLDLGLSSDQLADDQRGFGFQTSAPLDMRFDDRSGESVAELLARSSVDDLKRLLAEFGDESRSKQMAVEILKRRDQGQLKTASDLRLGVEAVVGTRHTGSHPATRIFQALRIAVNHELEHLEHFLSDVLPRRLAPRGRVAIITFHSLEDRLVKNALREVTLWDNLTRKPVVPTPSEVRINPRSRSAKLRVATRRE